jgi:hypothetical protein
MSGSGTGPICPACGHPAAVGTRFCTRCGAALPVPVAGAEAPQSGAPEVARAAPIAEERPARAPQQSPPRWTLDTPPANESWWRNPVVLAVAVVTVLFGSGVASWRFFIASSDTVSAIHAPRGEPSPPATTPTVPPPTSKTDEAALVAQVMAIVRRSEMGLRAVRGGDYAGALDNRRRLVAEVDRLEVPPEPARLAHAVMTLRAALAASARADRSHIACGCDERLPQDVSAHDLKYDFADEFDPYARRYLGHPVDPERI